MKAKEYIISSLEGLHKKFSNLSVKYRYDSNTLMHIVEVLPQSEFEANKEYMDFEAEFTYTFDDRFFPESVLFVSEESLTKVETPEFEIFPNVVPTEMSQKPLLKDVDTFSYSNVSNYVFSGNKYSFAA